MTDQQYPPDPIWGIERNGQFRYMDYDGESLRIWRNASGDLWVDKRGEGPVYVRNEDIPIIVNAIQNANVIRHRARRQIVQPPPEDEDC